LRAFFGGYMRTIEWDREKQAVLMIDQRRLPGELIVLQVNTADEMIDAIRSMIIRGAPALGVAGAFGVALAAQELSENPVFDWYSMLEQASQAIKASRPTAINLTWGVNRMMRVAEFASENLKTAASLILDESLKMAEEDVDTNLKLSKNGASLINDGDVLIHHCNTGALAGVEWGTALGAIRYAHESGKKVKVLIDETRPRLQGARLTAWECEQYGIPYEIITDNAAGHFLQRGEVNAVFFGADRVAANGDVVNKVGTYMLSLAAKANHVPVYCVFPKSSVDLSIPAGKEIVIEERDPIEVLGISFQGEKTSPETAHARNPAFDLTPNELITAWVTEDGVIYSPFKKHFQ
jgi:methylthioribose-1-phosphate isomerase